MRIKINALFLLFIIPLILVGNNDKKSTLTANFITGTPNIQSIKTIAMGPEGILFIGDNKSSTIFAIDLEDNTPVKDNNALQIDQLNHKLATQLGIQPSNIKIISMVVNPISHNIYLLVENEDQPDAGNVIFKIACDATISDITLENVSYNQIQLKDAPNEGAKLWRRDARTYTFTDMAYKDGELFVSGLSNEEFASSLRRVTFPFNGTISTTGLQVYHVSHGKNETHAPIYKFLPYQLGEELHIVAGYLCTPLVTFAVPSLKDNAKVVGKTVAELGAGNSPCGITAYQYKGEDFVVVGNNVHPLMKFKPVDLAKAKGVQYPSRERGVKRQNSKQGSIRGIADYNEEYLVLLNKDKKSKDWQLRCLAKKDI